MNKIHKIVTHIQNINFWIDIANYNKDEIRTHLRFVWVYNRRRGDQNSFLGDNSWHQPEIFLQIFAELLEKLFWRKTICVNKDVWCSVIIQDDFVLPMDWCHTDEFILFLAGWLERRTPLKSLFIFSGAKYYCKLLFQISNWSSGGWFSVTFVILCYELQINVYSKLEI